MVRFILVGVGVVTTALAGYLAKRKFFSKSTDEVPAELMVYPPSPRTKARRGRRSQLNEVLDNGEHESADLA